jgi:adenine-specific DNA methylase
MEFRAKWARDKREIDRLEKERDEIDDQIDALHVREHQELRQQSTP